MTAPLSKKPELSGETREPEIPFRIPDDLQQQYHYAQRCMDEDEPFGYGPTKVVQLIERIARSETREKALEFALRDMLKIAEFDRWHCASTGRQIVYGAAVDALGRNDCAMHKHLIHVEHDEWGRPVVYLAEYHDLIGGGGQCLFTSAEAAIFYVVTGLGVDIDWSSFPDPSLKYPNEERNGSEDPQLNPLFCVDRKVIDQRVWGKVSRSAAMDEWTVGNGIAESSKTAFLQATGRDLAKLSGEGDRLHAKVNDALSGKG